MRCSNLSLLYLVCLAFPVQAAQPNLSDISGTWSGLDKSTVANQLSSVVLTIEAVSNRSIAGTLVSTTVPYYTSDEPVTTPNSINGEYSPATGILRFHSLQDGLRSGPDMLAVFDENATAMAIIHTQNQAQRPPFIFYRGDEVRASLLALADLDPRSATAQSARKESSQQQRSQAKDAKAQYKQDTKDLNAQIAESVKARDTELTAELRAQMKALKKNYAARRVGGMTQSSGTSVCPEHVLAWANETENNGASLLRSNGFIELSNLFRPSIFAPYFDKPFTDLSAAELQDLITAMQGSCRRDGSALAKGGTRIPLGNVVSSRTGYGVTEAGLAGIAQELISGWYGRTSEPVLGEGSLDELRTFDTQGDPFLRMLWPDQVNAGRTALFTRIQDLIEENVSAQLESIAAGLKAGDVNALNDLHRLSSSLILHDLERSRAKRMGARLLEITDSGIAEHLEITRRRLQEIADPMERLFAGWDWYVTGVWALQNFAPYSPSVTPFWPVLGADREKAYRDLKSQLLAEIDAIESRPAAVAFGYDFKIDIDDLYSPTWLAINLKRLALVRSIDYEAHVIRVGEGPFGPNFTGAILLNAIYRYDLEQIADEDRLFHEAFISQTAGLTETPFAKLAELLAGGSGTGAEAKSWLKQEIRSSSMISPMLGFFVVSYEHIYPECMESDAIPFSKTTHFETVVTNGWGVETGRYSSGSSTEHWLINRRHAAAFEKLDGETNSPESIGFFGNLWGNQIQVDMRESLQFLSNSMRGLREAMQENGCNSAVMKKLDENMLKIYAAKFL